jgi:carbamoyltransferase
MSWVLGLHNSFTATSHDSSATLVHNGLVIGAIEEERISRKKTSTGNPPSSAIRELLERNNLKISDIDLCVSDGTTVTNMSRRVSTWLEYEFGYSPKLNLIPQYIAHTLGSFFSSGWKEALSISVEGSGDKISTYVTICRKDSNGLLADQIVCYEADSTKSLGNFYTMFTQYLGFEAIEGEYKVMGMSALGNPTYDLSSILSFNKNSGDIDSKLPIFQNSLYPISLSEPFFNVKSILKEIKLKPRVPKAEILEDHLNLASSVQETFKQAYVGLIQYWVNKTGIKKVCLSGGCALNALANMELLKLNLEGLYVMPAASDRGVSLGAALWGSNLIGEAPQPVSSMDLGRDFNNDFIESELKSFNIPLTSTLKINDTENLVKNAVRDLTKGKIIGWFQGRSEFGPRALGNRSILANPRIPGMKSHLNKKIKFREDYRPFAPAIHESCFPVEYPRAIDLTKMTVTIPIHSKYVSNFPEAVHSDGTSRVQLVPDNLSLFSRLLHETKIQHGHGSLINTSFNLKGEPIVDSPSDAIRTFYSSGIDTLYIGSFRISKSD